MRKVLVILFVALVSCENGLNLKPKMQIDADEAFSTEENIYAALIGCYDGLQQQHYYGRNLIIVGDIASDNSIATGTKIEYYSVDENALLSDNILVEGIWREIYTAINRVNYMLYKLEGVTFLSAEKMNDYQGQLRFLRALHYFNLVRLYGGVPLKLLPTLNTNSSNFLPRSSVQDVYNLIILDLEFAEQNITNVLPHKATVKSSKAMLASVNLTLENYSNALYYSNEVLSMNSELENNLNELFANSAEPSREIIFYVPFTASDKNRMAEYHLPNQLSGRWENSPSQKLISMIDAGDERKEFAAAHITPSDNQRRYYTKKYKDLSTGTDNIIVFRNAEMYLIRAEANYMLDSIANLNAILDDINAIRNRANLPNIESVSVGNSLIGLIDKEKQIEFAFEGKRWFDLIRTGKALGAVPTIDQAYQFFFPIPQSEIIANPNIDIEDQNEGY